MKLNEMNKTNEMNEMKEEETKMNEEKVEVNKMKEYSVKELCEILNIKEGTFRSWMLKVVEGEVYYRTNINYREICKNVRAKFEGEEEKIEKSEIDLTDYEAQYGSKPSISEAYVVICEVTYSGSKATEDFQYDCYVGKVSGKWKLFNVQYRAGTITTDMEVTDPEQYADSDDISSAA